MSWMDIRKMSKKGILSLVVAVAVLGTGVAILKKEKANTDNAKPASEAIVETKVSEKDKPKIKASELHKDILRQIASGKETICKISPSDAEQELERRSGTDLEIDKKPADVTALPFEIVKLIARSPATIAGIQPKKATNELVRRYLSIDLTDPDDVNSAILLETLQHRGEKKAIEDWAKNEDAEAVEAFLKEEADKDPSSIANFAIGLKKLDNEHELAMNYMDRYANHAHGDAFDNPDEEKAYKELIEAVKKLQ